MDAWHAGHLFALGMWGGLVAAEGVVELAPRNDEERRLAARLHYWMDLLIELPILAAVVTTGAMLLGSAWPPSPLVWVKIGAGLLAVAANLWCVVHVIVRYRQLGDAGALRRHGRLVRLTATVGLPSAALALFLGLSHFAG